MARSVTPVSYGDIAVPTQQGGIETERCDLCGAQAQVRAVLESGLDLTFCGHHGRKYEAALVTGGARLSR